MNWILWQSIDFTVSRLSLSPTFTQLSLASMQQSLTSMHQSWTSMQPKTKKLQVAPPSYGHFNAENILLVLLPQLHII